MAMFTSISFSYMYIICFQKEGVAIGRDKKQGDDCTKIAPSFFSTKFANFVVFRPSKYFKSCHLEVSIEWWEWKCPIFPILQRGIHKPRGQLRGGSGLLIQILLYYVSLILKVPINGGEVKNTQKSQNLFICFMDCTKSYKKL